VNAIKKEKSEISETYKKAILKFLEPKKREKIQ
jgi:hypothetical protein